MSRNGSGTFNINSAGQPVVAGTTITATAFNAFTADIGVGLTQSICVDGQSIITGNIPMASHKLTGLSDGTSAGDSLSYGQSAANFTSATITTLTSTNASVATNLTAPSNFGNTKRNAKSAQAAGVQFSMFSWPLTIDNLQQGAIVKIIGTNDDVNSGYAGTMTEVAFVFGSFGGVAQASVGTTVGGATFSVNAGITAISVGAAITIAAGVATLKLTPNSSGVTGFTTARVTAQIELLGSQDNAVITAL